MSKPLEAAARAGDKLTREPRLGMTWENSPEHRQRQMGLAGVHVRTFLDAALRANLQLRGEVFAELMYLAGGE